MDDDDGDEEEKYTHMMDIAFVNRTNGYMLSQGKFKGHSVFVSSIFSYSHY